MFSLSDIISAAQGGQGVNNIAAQFGLTPEQAQAAIKALTPAMSAGLQNQLQNSGAIGNIIGSMMHPQNQTTFQDPNVAQAPQTVDAGNNILGQIFGSPAVSTQIASHAAQMSGISQAVLQQMLPVLASTVLGGMFHSMQNQGLAGTLAQMAGNAVSQNAAGQSGLGGMLGQMMGGNQNAMGGMIGSVLGSLMGGGQAAPTSQTAAPVPGQSPAMQAGMEALSKMMQAGVEVSAAHHAGLQEILGQVLAAAAKK